MAKVSFTEYHLRHPDKLKGLAPETQRLFWGARHWHPLVRMKWEAEIFSNGEGVLTFPDGRKSFYNGASPIQSAG